MERVILLGIYAGTMLLVASGLAAIGRYEEMRQTRKFKERIKKHRHLVARRNWKRDLLATSKEFSEWVNRPRLEAPKEEI